MTDEEKAAAERAAAEKLAGEEAKKKTSKKKADDVDTIALTPAELEAKIAEAIAVNEKKHEAAAAEAKKKQDEETARKSGEFEKLYKSEAEGRKAAADMAEKLRLDLRRQQIEFRLHTFVAKNNPDYAGSVNWMLPSIKVASADMTDEEADKQIKSVTEQYIKDNPRAAKFGTTTHHNRGTASGNDDEPKQKPKVEIPTYARNF